MKSDFKLALFYHSPVFGKVQYSFTSDTLAEIGCYQKNILVAVNNQQTISPLSMVLIGQSMYMDNSLNTVSTHQVLIRCLICKWNQSI